MCFFHTVIYLPDIYSFISHIFVEYLLCAGALCREDTVVNKIYIVCRSGSNS